MKSLTQGTAPTVVALIIVAAACWSTRPDPRPLTSHAGLAEGSWAAAPQADADDSDSVGRLERSLAPEPTSCLPNMVPTSIQKLVVERATTGGVISAEWWRWHDGRDAGVYDPKRGTTQRWEREMQEGDDAVEPVASAWEDVAAVVPSSVRDLLVRRGTTHYRCRKAIVLAQGLVDAPSAELWIDSDSGLPLRWISRSETSVIRTRLDGIANADEAAQLGRTGL